MAWCCGFTDDQPVFHKFGCLAYVSTFDGTEQPTHRALANFFRGLYHGSQGRVHNRGVTGIIKARSEEHTSELQSRGHLVCRLLLEKKKTSAHRMSERCST